MTKSVLAMILLLGAGVVPVCAADLRLLPADVALTGPGASQRLLVVVQEGKHIVGDRTAKATFTSSNPAVAQVSAAGVVSAAGDGEAVITASIDGAQATAKVKVAKTKEPYRESFRNHIIPILTRAGCNSGACHGALAGKGGMKLSLRGYDPDTDHFVLTRQAGGRRVDCLEPARSLLLRKATLAMPHAGGLRVPVDSADFRILSDWIAGGAPGPRSDDPVFQRLEVLPAAATLKPGDSLQVLVRAWYADGHVEDVTRWAKFASSEELVVKIDETGQATVASSGEAAITVWYSNLVAIVTISVPLPNPVPTERFTKAERHNFIDDHVLAKLQALRIPPSPLCSDEEFIRRAYLDATGILPAPEEVQQFLADKGNDKRARLIDSLLQRPEFVDYWSYKWSDMLLVSSRRLAQPAVWAFYQFVRQSVAENRPWDRFARDILTASGSNLQNGAANYFVLHKDVTDLTETTCVTFLGMSLTCARCHNHPLEKWTQDQYWALANLFARVALKNGERTGEISVQSLPAGDAPHPRRGEPMPPTPLDGKPLLESAKLDRRQYLAEWLTADQNPYFAKALVNRVWRNFMGRGLVEAEDDLRQTNPPTNPELFDALARDFIQHRYDVKHLIRTIMNSAAYQRSSRPLPENAADDRFYSRYIVRRLSAEVILDAYSQVTAVPTPFTHVYSGVEGGTAAYSGYPLGTRALQLADGRVASSFLDSFGRPDRSVACSCERQQDSSVSQALHINNGKTLNDKLRAKNSRVDQWVAEKIGDEEAIGRIFLLALCREPTPAEKQKMLALLADAARDKSMSRRDVLEDLFWSVLSGKEFLFNR
jgi:hypothetical protein